ncbi:MarR family transcriptional regulator [Paenibacillus sp. LHD-117]|uniref:MarR family winged helix-turn-helix transcriptional regulator n=1 Tax=Paenibacillus sp. LHD-117 TaxID=3071412 RepID=UPI0027DFD4D1|nr:MarR family transcriptional regulator [Paenibacillus sp. LHD-117]MDQ6419761.1 MarR family transcriptional regulator [Paenibacillus sp. LHD-117]
MDDRDIALLEEADWLFRKLVRRFVKERDKIAIDGVALPGMLILNAIAREGEQRLGELAERLDFTSGAVTAQCDKLEAGGYAIRKRSETDRRSIVLDIMPKGRELLVRTRETGGYMIDLLFGSFTKPELEAQIVIYKRLIDHLEQFADKVMLHAGEEAAVTVPPRKQVPNKPANRFISY